MDEPHGPDERLLAELGELLDRSTPVPSRAVGMAKELYTWRTIDGELAELTTDSLLDRPLTGVRAATEPRALTFEASDLMIELEVVVSGPRRRLVGQLIPPTAARIEVRQGAATRVVEADGSGRFQVKDLAAGPITLRLQLPGRRPIITEPVRP